MELLYLVLVHVHERVLVRVPACVRRWSGRAVLA